VSRLISADAAHFVKVSPEIGRIDRSPTVPIEIFAIA
jgi:hypothetical protein